LRPSSALLDEHEEIANTKQADIEISESNYTIGLVQDFRLCIPIEEL
jgi:hypothetical protein